MTTHRLEVYVDSYSNEPIVKEIDKSLSINIGDEISKESWLKLLSGTDARIELRMKVEDVQHLFFDVEDCVHSVSIKVVPVC